MRKDIKSIERIGTHLKVIYNGWPDPHAAHLNYSNSIDFWPIHEIHQVWVKSFDKESGCEDFFLYIYQSRTTHEFKFSNETSCADMLSLIVSLIEEGLREK